MLPADDEMLEIPIVYGGEYGPDLEGLCDELSMTKDEFVSLHTGTEYRVEMICDDKDILDVVAALRAAHPYEEPAYDVVALADF